MVCVLSRASRSYVVGHAHHNHDADLAIAFISDSHSRTDKLWRDFIRQEFVSLAYFCWILSVIMVPI